VINAYFLNMASVGLSVEVSRGLSQRLKRWPERAPST
jgi:hypothetical protein